MHSCTDTQAVCRGCGQLLDGRPYWKGGRAYVLNGNGGHSHAAKANYYGGWVCSRTCDIRASRELENSMPGHGYNRNSVLDRSAQSRIDSNWGEEE